MNDRRGDGEGRVDGEAGVGGTDLLTLEPLVEAVRDGVEHAGWTLSGLQKTTSHEFGGAWDGESTRSAYLFFHREDLPETVAVEAYLDETSQGLRGNLALVLEGPALDRIGAVRGVLERVDRATSETFPTGYRTPVSLRVGTAGSRRPVGEAGVHVRVKLTIPGSALEVGASAVSALSSEAVVAFEALLERPEVAELLPPVIE